jgi:hypothetical protein
LKITETCPLWQNPPTDDYCFNGGYHEKSGLFLWKRKKEMRSFFTEAMARFLIDSLPALEGVVSLFLFTKGLIFSSKPILTLMTNV